jgi:hypothetical protein
MVKGQYQWPLERINRIFQAAIRSGIASLAPFSRASRRQQSQEVPVPTGGHHNDLPYVVDGRQVKREPVQPCRLGPVIRAAFACF